MKISSRAGRFKKKLVNHETLGLEGPVVEDRLMPLFQLYSQKSITASEFCALYIILYLSVRFPKTWLGAARPSLNLDHRLNFPLKSAPLTFEDNIQKRLPETIGDVFNHFAMRSTPEAVNRALLHWSTETYPLILMFSIPRPAEVLNQQKNGRRCVTVVTKNLHQFVLGERDPLSFTMHDLIHADHFYHDNQCYEGQISLYWFLDHCMQEGLFEELLKKEDFAREFEYLTSDMNAYAIHSLKCLKAAIIHYHPDKEVFFETWVKKIALEEGSWLRLSTPAYSEINEDHLLLKAISTFRR